ncbi:hypothetical protein J3E68DRAFT_165315 [Trichoderma sp. SZMC 28012]
MRHPIFTLLSAASIFTGKFASLTYLHTRQSPLHSLFSFIFRVPTVGLQYVVIQTAMFWIPHDSGTASGTTMPRSREQPRFQWGPA